MNSRDDGVDFVAIAKFGNQYQALGHVHVEEMSLEDAVSSCRKLMSIFGEEINQRALNQELGHARRAFEEQTPPDIRQSEPPSRRKTRRPCPFPFISTCLVIGANYDGNLNTLRTMLVNVIDSVFRSKPYYEPNQCTVILDVTDMQSVRCGLIEAERKYS